MQYLIGPKLFPIFLLVLKIVGAVLLVLAIVGTGIKIGLDGLNGQEAAQRIGRYALEFMSGIIALLLNFYPRVLGIYFFSGDVRVFLPALSEAFFRMLPWINVTWILGIGLNAWLLREGRWTPRDWSRPAWNKALPACWSVCFTRS